MTCVNRTKTGAPLPKLEEVVMEGHEFSIDIEWSIDPLYPDQTVTVAYRKSDNSDTFTVMDPVPRDDGAITIDGLVTETEYTIWMRPETASHVGEWQSFVGITQEGWGSGFELVIHDGDSVTFNGEVVVVRIA